MDIDLNALRLVERDREIPFAELVEIIEAAIVAAYNKSVGHNDSARAVLDQKTGKVAIMVPDTEERDEQGKLLTETPDGVKIPEVDKTPDNFGRIAAAAAKQKNKPKVSASIYKSTIKMDRDKDGTVCEK